MFPDYLQQFADWVTYSVLGLVQGTALASSVNFFIYDSIKVTLMLAVIVFAVAIVRTFITPQKVKKLVGGTYRRSWQRTCGTSWHPHTILFVLGSAALHRFCRVRCTARDHVLVPDCITIDQ